MAVPKRKTSKSKNKMRQAGKGLVRKNNIKIDTNGEIQLSHHLIIKKVKKKQANETKED